MQFRIRKARFSKCRITSSWKKGADPSGETSLRVLCETMWESLILTNLVRSSTLPPHVDTLLAGLLVRFCWWSIRRCVTRSQWSGISTVRINTNGLAVALIDLLTVKFWCNTIHKRKKYEESVIHTDQVQKS